MDTKIVLSNDKMLEKAVEIVLSAWQYGYHSPEFIKHRPHTWKSQEKRWAYEVGHAAGYNLALETAAKQIRSLKNCS